MANQPVKTTIHTPDKIMHLQEFWVKHKGKPTVKDVVFEGDLTQTTAEVLQAIVKADYIILGPSNPVSSVGPILSLKPLRQALREASGKKIAISPIIGSEAVSGPTVKFLSAWNYKISPKTIPEMFRDFLDGFVLHHTDKSFSKAISSRHATLSP